MYNENQVMDLVRKALSVDSSTGTSIQPFIKEDLEDEAYLQLYTEADPQQLAFLKDFPRQNAQQVNHEFVIVDHYGNHKAKASFAPNSLPAQANIEGARKVVNLKVYGKTTAVQGLTVLQNSVKALGQADIASSNDLVVRMHLMHQINNEIIASDTRDTLDGNVFKGCIQLIDEMTKSPSAMTKFSNGDVFKDKRGQSFSAEDIRGEAVGVGKRNGILRRLYMAPEVLEAIENTLDPAARLQIGAMNANNNKGVIIGGSVDGMRVQGSVVYFRRDVAMSTYMKTGTPNKVMIPGAPAAFAFGGAGAGTITQPAVNNAGVGKFQTTGERLTGMQYIVCAVNEIGESIGSNLSASVNATAGKTIEFTITPRGNEHSFRIYRGYVADPAQDGTFMKPVYREPMLIAEIPNGVSLGNTNPITVVDDDDTIPGTTWVIGGDIFSPNAASLDQGAMPSNPANEYTVGKSSIAIAQLTGLFEFDLAKLGWLYSNKLFAQVLAPMVPRPFANVIWRNVPPHAEIRKTLIDRPV